MLPTALIALATLSPAHALDCAAAHVGGILPADGATDVAVNVLPMVQVYGDGERVALTLLADGDEVEGASWSRIAEGDPEMWQLTTPAELDAHTAYTVVASDNSGFDEPYTMAEYAFSTGEDIDTTPPEAISGAFTDHDTHTSEWGREASFIIDLEGGDDASGTAWLLELTRTGDFADAETRIRLGNPATVSRGLCTFDPVGDWDPDVTDVRITPIDAAGNQGPAVERSFAEPAGKESRCSVVPVHTFGFLGTLLGLLGVSRRRRR